MNLHLHLHAVRHRAQAVQPIVNVMTQFVVLRQLRGFGLPAHKSVMPRCSLWTILQPPLLLLASAFAPASISGDVAMRVAFSRVPFFCECRSTCPVAPHMISTGRKRLRAYRLLPRRHADSSPEPPNSPLLLTLACITVFSFSFPFLIFSLYFRSSSPRHFMTTRLSLLFSATDPNLSSDYDRLLGFAAITFAASSAVAFLSEATATARLVHPDRECVAHRELRGRADALRSRQ